MTRPGMPERDCEAGADLVGIRRHLHAIPELAFAEHETSAYVARWLDRHGIGFERIAGTGMVATLRNGTSTRSVGLRADMDALPITERTGLPWASRHAGRMHACGHDGHTAMLLGAAHRLATARRFDGTVHLIFQPAEEDISGARRMVAEGLFERFPCDTVFALHNLPGYGAGEVCIGDGPVMAASDVAQVHLTGRGGHGAAPHTTADPVVAGAAIVTALQTIVARSLDPADIGVVTVGEFHAGDANGVIPETARLSVMTRSCSPNVRERLERRLRTIVEHQAAAHGVGAEIDWQYWYPATVNTPAETAHARESARAIVGSRRVHALGRPLAFSEDFSYLLERCPGCYLFLGAGDIAPLHSPHYDFNDRILETGADLLAGIAEGWLARAG